MKPKDCNTKKKKYVHLSERDRYKIEGLLEGKKNIEEIAKILRRDRSTIYREIKRGTVRRRQYDYSEKYQYRANTGQADYDKQGQNKERGLKIGKDKGLEAYIRIKLIKERFSPDAIIGQIKAEGLRFEGIITTKTLYNYIDAGFFSGISNENLWQKRNKKKRGYKTVSRVNTKNRDCRSIEDRPKKVDNRVEYGHWEGDTVKGPMGTKTGLFTLTERKTREEIIIKICDGTQAAIRESIDGLEIRYGARYKAKFKSITFDNGVEFLGWKTLEISILNPEERRTMIYFAYSYSSWERGTNENQNRMIRRFIPKGVNIAEFSDEDIQEIEDWMNNYPRKILGYKTANQMAKKYLQSDSFGKRSKRVAL
ncbi:MAG: IS30 family transposase [Candidatus Omnitrophica bacterium]|nr:IS30 family transposase [Candidatus Omnitrophota bacterium]MBU4334586.1 IS30 family transposase [Candidatus Omnitrophota bacterium]